MRGPQVHILGVHNFLFIAVIIVAVFRPGVFERRGIGSFGGPSLAAVARGADARGGASASRRMTRRDDLRVERVHATGRSGRWRSCSSGSSRRWCRRCSGWSTTPGQLPAAHAGAVLLRVGDAVVGAGQRADVPDVPADAAGRPGRRRGRPRRRRSLAGMKGRRTSRTIPEPLARRRCAGGGRRDDRVSRRGRARRARSTRRQLEIAFLLGTPRWNVFVVAISRGGGVLRRVHVHRERAELHGEVDRRRGGRADAGVSASTW